MLIFHFEGNKKIVYEMEYLDCLLKEPIIIYKYRIDSKGYKTRLMREQENI